MIESIIEENKISQIAISKNMIQKNNFNLNKYIGRNTATLFYGVNNANDLNLILKHKGKKIIFFDINKVQTDLKSIIIRLKSNEIKKNLIKILCDNVDTENALKEQSILATNINSDTKIEDIYENKLDNFDESVNEVNIIEETILASNQPQIIQVDMDSFEEELKEKTKDSKLAKRFNMYVKEISNDEIPKNELFKQFMTSYEKFHEENKLNEDKYFEFISTQESSLNESIDEESNDNESVKSSNSIHSDDDLNINYETKDDVPKNISTLNL